MDSSDIKCENKCEGKSYVILENTCKFSPELFRNCVFKCVEKDRILREYYQKGEKHIKN